MIQPSLLQVVRTTLAGAPITTRRSVITGLVLWLAMMVLQGFDSADRSGPAAVAEFLSVLCGTGGGLLLAFTGILNASAERSVAAERRTGPEADGYRRVLLALPAVGLVSAALFSAAIPLMLVRGLLGAELPLVIILTTLFLVFLGFAAATVIRSTRVLYSHAQMEAQDASAARLAAGEARLAALQARMNPHFLFNALNTVAALVRTEPAAAERVTENLSGVLRMTLERSAERIGTVGDEVDYLEAWLAVEQERWKDRLRIEWRIEPGTEPAAIPPLLLQPLVENSIRHGLGGRIEGGTITISTKRVGDRLELAVVDDGIGFPAAYREGTGLGNLRQRLASIYGERAILTSESLQRGAKVVVNIPYQDLDARADR